MASHSFEEVLVNHEALIFKRGRILPESFALPLYAQPYQRPDHYVWFLVKNYLLRRRGVTIPSGLWVIDNLSDNYYHWLVDALPRLLLAEERLPDQNLLLIPRRYQGLPFVQFTLTAFPQIRDIYWIGDRATARVGNLHYVAREPAVVISQAPEYRSDLIRGVAKRVGNLVPKSGGERRIYFSRADAQRRRALNEKDVQRVLKSHDIEVIEINPQAPWEQIEASRSASLIVGIHGAALTNVIFMPPGGVLLELRQGGDRFLDVYGGLAQAVDVSHRSQVCALAHETSGWDANHADLIVDLDQLRENLATAPAR